MRGFVTIAVGDEQYFKLAVNLLDSYKIHTACIMPWAIITDRENQYTNQFDKVILLENAARSYMDKIEMLNNPPWEDNIFIDADCLAYGDLNALWNYYPNGAVSCIGQALPTTSKDGWFVQEDIGEYQNRITFIPQMHGGVLFFRDDADTREIYKLALTISKDYSKYRFKFFSKPADEPILALSMAVLGVKPIELSQDEKEKAFVFYPSAKKVKCNMAKGLCSYYNDQTGWVDDVLLVHWQNVNTNKPLYRTEVKRMTEKNPLAVSLCKVWYGFDCFIIGTARRFINRVKRTFWRFTII